MPKPTMDPYAVLGVGPDATPLQVARAHRRLAKRFHPDLHPDQVTADRMREINDAWRILSSPERRTAHDQAAQAGAAAPPASHWAASRRPIRPVQPTTTRNWASWRASAAETRAAPRTRRAPGEVHEPATRRPQLQPTARPFRESGWVALIMAGLFLAVVLAAMVAGRLAVVP